MVTEQLERYPKYENLGTGDIVFEEGVEIGEVRDYGKIEIFRLFEYVINMMYNSCMIFSSFNTFIFLSPLGGSRGDKRRDGISGLQGG
jgi:hypothetical protein